MNNQNFKVGDRVFICKSAWRQHYGDIFDFPKYQGFGTISEIITYTSPYIYVRMNSSNIVYSFQKSYLVLA